MTTLNVYVTLLSEQQVDRRGLHCIDNQGQSETEGLSPPTPLVLSDWSSVHILVNHSGRNSRSTEKQEIGGAVINELVLRSASTICYRFESNPGS
ncbi:hypothetical protein PoB_003873500 [Plakobranchus ocellatus]|uniref:Uncharacterized protein n=1 Tax=Plakobranchus ocellatus TaxID=259542 RepID=A0AAV4AY78_9GAST|nr:hypothetical protein PoB_003873500 [Plakobranchus ocellatus]